MAEIQQVVREQVRLPTGYVVSYGGQFEAQQTATRRVAILSVVALVVIFLVLYSTYPSASIVLQILIALPAAFVGGVLALWLSGQSFSVASLVGFISLGGIAARNGLLLVSTYLGLIPEKGFAAETVLAGQPRSTGAGADDRTHDRHWLDSHRRRRTSAGQRVVVSRSRR